MKNVTMLFYRLMAALSAAENPTLSRRRHSRGRVFAHFSSPPLAAGLVLALIALFSLPGAGGTAQADVLVSNVGQPTLGNWNLDRGEGHRTNRFAFTTGPSHNYTLTSVEISFATVRQSTANHAVAIHEYSNGALGRKLGDLTAPASLTSGSLNTFTASGITLRRNTTYFLAISSANGPRNEIWITASDAEDSTSLTGWSIANSGVQRKNSNGAESTFFASSVPLFRLNGTISKEITSQWSPQSSGLTTDLNDVYFVDANNGWVVGDNGKILRTTNGGATWTAQTSGITYNLNDVYFADAREGWVVGSFGTILHTTDGGATWSYQDNPVPRAIGNVDFVDARRGWVRTTAEVLRTTDGGATWQTQDPGVAEDYYGLDFVNAWIGWVVGTNGTILRTTDRGATWTAQSSGTTNSLLGVDFADYRKGWAVGISGTILRTTDGGDTWRTQTSGTDEGLFAMDFIDDRYGWVVGGVGTILRTTDGGVSWSAQSSGTTQPLYGVHFLPDASKGWAVGRGGTILAFDYQLPALDLGLELFHECCIYEGRGKQLLQLKVDLAPRLPHHAEVSMSYDLGETADDFESFHVEDVTIPAGWDWTTSVVTATPLDDALREPEQRLTVTASVTADGGTFTASQELKLIDDDPYGRVDPDPGATPGVSVSPTALTVDEAGSAATYSVGLDSQPTGTVTISVSSSDVGAATASPASLIFTPDDWFMPQTVTVTGINDDVDNPGDRRTVTITHSASGGGYGGWAVGSVSVTVRDDDSGDDDSGSGSSSEVDVVLSTTRISVHEGIGNAAYGVTLASRPSETVTVSVSSSDTSAVTVGESVLTFTPDDWDMRQLVWVFPVDDDIDNPHDRVAVITNTASGGGNSATVTVTVLDDD